MTRQIQRLGWIPDLPDARDIPFAAPLKAMLNLPPKLSLRAKMPAIYDQLNLGSCTAFAVGAMEQYVRNKMNARYHFQPAQLFIYYNERALEGTIGFDSGAYLRDGIKTVADVGVCPESLWPYDIARFTEKPSAKAYDEAKKHRAIAYMRIVQSLVQMKSCLADGFPFVFGFTVYESFMDDSVAASGIMPLPLSGESVVGGHAVCAVGYNDATQMMQVRNSWGKGWGLGGYFWMPYGFIADPGMASDFWTIRSSDP